MSNLRFCNFFLLGFALAVGNMCLLYLADTGVFWNGYIPSGIVLAIGGTILATVYAALTRFGRGMVKLSLDHLGQLQESIGEPTWRMSGFATGFAAAYTLLLVFMVIAYARAV